MQSEAMFGGLQLTVAPATPWAITMVNTDGNYNMFNQGNYYIQSNAIAAPAMIKALGASTSNLSAWTLFDDKTLQPLSGTYSTGPYSTFYSSAAASACHYYELVWFATKALSQTQLEDIVKTTSTDDDLYGPLTVGQMSSYCGPEQVIWGMWRLMGTQANLNSGKTFVQVDAGQFGSGEAIAARELYAYRYILLLDSGASIKGSTFNLNIPPCTVRLNLAEVDFTSLQHNMAIKRNLE